ncbi:MAG: NAD(P)H-dependent oxidoreductase [Desulfovibrionaceae bacterium]|nr:NAD(P)H-dependent oxidoreductase [Desulfovibrionaceae bacterium]
MAKAPAGGFGRGPDGGPGDRSGGKSGDLPDDLSDGLLILAASPNASGTTMRLARLAAAGAAEAGRSCGLVSLHGLHLSGCTNCGACARAPHACPKAARDGSADIYARIRAAGHVLWISPVYFYGLPAQAKALVDASQHLYMAALHGALAPARGRMTALFAAGRPKGARLFDGSRQTVRYFAEALRCPLAAACGLRGLDAPGDIAPQTARAVTALGRALAAGEEFCAGAFADAGLEELLPPA